MVIMYHRRLVCTADFAIAVLQVLAYVSPSATSGGPSFITFRTVLVVKMFATSLDLALVCGTNIAFSAYWQIPLPRFLI